MFQEGGFCGIFICSVYTYIARFIFIRVYDSSRREQRNTTIT